MVATPVEEVPVEAAPVEEVPAKKLPLNIKPIALAAGVLAVVIILSCFIIPALFAGHEAAVKNWIAVMEGKESKVVDLLPAAIWEYIEEENDKFDMDDFAEYFAENTLESLENQYGKGISISYTVEKKTALRPKKLEKIAEELAERYDIDEDDVKDGYKLKLTTCIEGDEDDDEAESEVIVIKIGSKWYLYSMISSIVSSAKYFG